MTQYRDLALRILSNGVDVVNERTGESTRSIFGHQMRFDLTEQFPIPAEKFTPFYLTVSELLWFMSGCTDNNVLHKFKNTIWDEWADEQGNLNKIYGYQWRNWEAPSGTFDQLQIMIDKIQNSPYDRGNIVSAWNVADLDVMALRPCHTLFQVYVRNGQLSLQLYQRSADVALGVPMNMASYSLLTHILARITNLNVGEFIHTFGDAHIYEKHIAGMFEVVNREINTCKPQLWISPELKTLDDFNIANFETLDDLKKAFKLEGYTPHPKYDFEITV